MKGGLPGYIGAGKPLHRLLVGIVRLPRPHQLLRHAHAFVLQAVHGPNMHAVSLQGTRQAVLPAVQPLGHMWHLLAPCIKACQDTHLGRVHLPRQEGPVGIEIACGVEGGLEAGLRHAAQLRVACMPSTC